MVRIEKNIRIEAPATEVFDYVTNPTNLPEVWPSMVEVKNVTREASGKHSFDWTYKMAGLKFHGHADTLEADRPRRDVTHNEAGIPSTFTWDYVEAGQGTELRLQIDYEMPGKLLERLAEPFIRRLNEREAETLLGNIKARLELGSVGAGKKAGKPTEVRA